MTKIKINEIFLSIQGEGIRIGEPTTFIRFSGCSNNCIWCDTTYAFSEGEFRTIEDIVQEVEKLGCPNICITGGEPLEQSDGLIQLVKHFNDPKYRITIETNGTLPIFFIPANVIWSVDYKCESAKGKGKFNLGNLDTITNRDQLKFIIGSRDDWDEMLPIVDAIKYKWAPGFGPTIILTPVFDNIINLKYLVEHSIKEISYDNIRVLPQLHKIIWPPEKRGV